jgi:type IV pilus assembly protein PilX
MTSKHFSTYRIRHSQQGTALVIGLIMLTVITLLSVSAMRSTSIDTKISVNQQFKQMSFLASESALAQLTGPEIDLDPPASLDASETYTDYFQAPGNTEQPGVSVDLTMTMVDKSRRYKFSGFPLNVLTIMYQADAAGTVANTNTLSTNRMQVALIRN